MRKAAAVPTPASTPAWRRWQHWKMPVSKSATSPAGHSRHYRPPQIWPNVFKGILSFHLIYINDIPRSMVWRKASLDQCLIMVRLLNYYRLIKLHLWCSDQRYTQDVCLLAKAGLLRRLSQNTGWFWKNCGHSDADLWTFPQAFAVSVCGWNGVEGVPIRFLSAQFEKDPAFY